jgi:hypothetical protein
VSYHRNEAERLLELIDTTNLAPGDLATVVLARAVLAVDDSITDGITEGIASLASTVDAAADRLADRLGRALKP